VKYRFMSEHRHEYQLAMMCRVLQVARAGFYAWLQCPVSDRSKDDTRLLELIRHSYTASHGVYGARRVFGDLREAGESCGLHRVERLMQRHKIKAVRGYKKPCAIAGRPSIIAPNHLQREFTVDAPNKVWVTDITYIRTWQGWLYLAVVLDLYARKVVGWSMKATLGRELALDALLMAVWRRKPQQRVLDHSDQGSQYVSIRYTERLDQAGIRPSVGSRGDSYDNALAETINGLYKAELIHRRGPWKTRESVELATLQWVHWFNHVRLLTPIGGIPPAEAEANYWWQLALRNTSIEVST